jgi:hypothetical protein
VLALQPMWLILVAAWAAPSQFESIALDAIADGSHPSLAWHARTVGETMGPRWVRLSPSHEGVPIIGADAVVAVGKDGTVLRTWGNQPVLPSGRFSLGESEARSAGRALSARLGRVVLYEPLVSQVIFGDRRSWQVDVGVAEPLGTWRTYLDAETGELSGTHATHRTAKGSVYPVSPALSGPETVELPRLQSDDTLTGDWADVVTCDESEVNPGLFGVSVCYSTTRTALPDDQGDYIYPPAPESLLEDPMAEVGAYYHVDRVAQWITDTYGTSMPESMQVHVNFPMDNAFYGDFDGDGSSDISLGQAENGVDYSYDSDVVYHEYGHAWVSQVSSLGFLGGDELGLDWTTGSLNEGTADVISMLLNGDPAMGEYAGLARDGGEPIRHLEADVGCPEHLYGEVHRNGEIWGSLFWNLLEHPDVTQPMVESLLVGSVSTWVNNPDWNRAGDSLAEASELLLAEGVLTSAAHEVVLDELAAFGLGTCERVIDLSTGTHSQLLMNLGLLGDFALIPGEVQYRYEIPANATGFAVEITDYDDGESGLGWSVFARQDKPVGHVIESLDVLGLAFAIPQKFDDSADGVGPGTALTIDGAPGEVWYLSVAGSNTGALDILQVERSEITVRVDGQFPEVATEEDAPRVGCGCVTGGEPLWLAWLPLAVTLLRRK